MTPALSPKERQIADLVAQGRTTKEIATELGLSRFTVSSYLRRIFAKLNVRSRAEMVAVLLGRPAPARDPLARMSSCPNCGHNLGGGAS